MVPNISGIILAGGESKRFDGIAKPNIIIAGKPIIYRITETIKDIFEEIIIVTNTTEEYKEYKNFKIVSDRFVGTGPLGGIHSALKASSKGAVFVFAGDMPLLNRKYIIRQIKFFCSNKCEILIPKIGQLIEPLHAIYDRSIIKALEEYLTSDHNNAVREFLKSQNVSYIQFKESEKTRLAFTNINSPSDVINIEKTLLAHLNDPQSAF
jgi:molybdopterin-guanine dinucleotide biosynthesis protein A